MTVSTTGRKWIGAASLLGIVLLWQLTASAVKLPLLFPTPAATLRQLAGLAVSADFWRHLAATLGRGLAGFSLALLSGATLGFWAGRREWLAALIHPWVVVCRSTPSMAFILLALLWLKGDAVALFVVFLVVFPIAVQNILEGVRNVDPELTEMTAIYRISPTRALKALYLPSLLPFLAAAISSGLGMTWKVMIAAEVLSYPKWGIGSQMDGARVFLQTDRVFAWTAVVVIIGLGFDWLLDGWARQMMNWRRNDGD
jgi:NitT/TauT family transport system permease protein